MLIDGLIQAWPDNDQLLIAGAQSYSTFASVFVEDQDKEYANLLYERGKQYALRSLEIRGLKNPLQSPFDDFRRAAASEKDISTIFGQPPAGQLDPSTDSMRPV
jgi:hypothetical protein